MSERNVTIPIKQLIMLTTGAGLNGIDSAPDYCRKDDLVMKRRIAWLVALALCLSTLCPFALAEDVFSAPAEIEVGEEEALLAGVDAEEDGYADFVTEGDAGETATAVMASMSDDELAAYAFPDAQLMSEVDYTPDASGRIAMPRPYGYKMDTSYYWSGGSGQTLSIQFEIGAEFGTQPYDISYKVYCGDMYLTGDTNIANGSKISLTGGNAYGTYSFVVAVEDAAGNRVCATLGEKVNVGFSNSSVSGDGTLTAPLYPGFILGLTGNLQSYTANESKVVIPAALKVSSIDSYAFSGCGAATSITIPEGVTYIDDYAFCKNTGYDGLNFNAWLQGLTTKSAGCPNLKHLYLPKSLTKVGEYAFYCLPEGVVIHTKHPELIEAKSVKLDVTEAVELVIGKTRKVKATISPTYAKSSVKWKSSKPSVASVSQKGVIKGLKAGKAVITATASNGGVKATLKVKVVAPQPKTVKITKGKSAKLKVGKTLALKTKLTPSNAKTKLTWSTSNKAVATVSKKGVVKAKKAGKAIITATAANGKKATIKIRVVKK